VEPATRLAGAEIRIHADNCPRVAHFGDVFIAYRTNVRALIPFSSMR
jgi:hypothetical protein